LGFVGTAGSGKSYNAMGRVERLLSRKARVCCVDPLGVFWGLRLDADGKSPSGFNIPIFGGPHGDLPLTEHSGALIGETVAGMAESCIIDLSEIGTKAGERRFMLHFLTALYRKANGEPLHLVIDEADMFAPQKINDKEGEAAKLLGMMETVVRRGRIKGFIPWLITQRPAVIAKDVLSQVDGLVAFKLTSSQDRDAISAWVEGSADKDDWKAMRGALPAMERGQGVVWIPGRGIMETVRFPEKFTFDSSRTPKRGEKKSAAALKPLDLGSLKERLATVDAETKANDPKALRARIVELERQKATTPPSAIFAASNATARAEGDRAGFERADRQWHGVMTAPWAAFTNAWQSYEQSRDRLNDAIREISHVVDVALQYRAPPKSGSPAIPAPAPKRAPLAPAVVRKPSPAANGDGSLPKGERLCLTAIAQNSNGITRQHLTVVTGYKRSTRDAYIQRLREKGCVDERGSRLYLTDAGGEMLGPFDPLPTGAALQDHVLGTLPEGERAVLALIIPAYPNGVDRDTISIETGYKRSTRDAYIQRLSTRELVDASRGGVVVASQDLFA
jgi:hypothetical protein